MKDSSSQAQGDVQQAFSGEGIDTPADGQNGQPGGPSTDDRPVRYEGDLEIDFRGPGDF